MSIVMSAFSSCDLSSCANCSVAASPEDTRSSNFSGPFPTSATSCFAFATSGFSNGLKLAS